MFPKAAASLVSRPVVTLALRREAWVFGGQIRASQVIPANLRHHQACDRGRARAMSALTLDPWLGQKCGNDAFWDAAFRGEMDYNEETGSSELWNSSCDSPAPSLAWSETTVDEQDEHCLEPRALEESPAPWCLVPFKIILAEQDSPILTRTASENAHSQMSHVGAHSRDASNTWKSSSSKPDNKWLHGMRSRGNYNCGDDSDGEQSPNRSSAKSPRREDSRSVRYACPFLKANRRRHIDCSRHQLTRISDVKQHIFRAHISPEHCARCQAVFPTDEDMTRHLRQDEPCQVLSPSTPLPPAVTDRQVAKLRSRLPRTLTDTEKWYTIWDILFPGLPQPASPYETGDALELLDSIKSSLTTSLSPTLCNNLRAHGLDLQQSELETLVSTALSAVLEIVHQTATDHDLLARMPSDPPRAEDDAEKTMYSVPEGRALLPPSSTLAAQRAEDGEGGLSSIAAEDPNVFNPSPATGTAEEEHNPPVLGALPARPEETDPDKAPRHESEMLLAKEDATAPSALPHRQSPNISGTHNGTQNGSTRINPSLRKWNLITNEMWAVRKPTLHRLYIEENLPLPKVDDFMKRHGFVASSGLLRLGCYRSSPGRDILACIHTPQTLRRSPLLTMADFTYLKIERHDPNIKHLANQYKVLRLKALEQSPTAFSSTLEIEAALSDDTWISRITDPSKEAFVCTATLEKGIARKGKMGATTATPDAGQALESFQFPDGPYPTNFNPNVSASFLEMTLRKVRDYRPVPTLSADWTIEGPPTQEIDRVAKFWANQYEWKPLEQKMNEEFDHFATVVPGSGNYTQSIPLHFVHQRSETRDAIPLLLLHGWPSSHLEWSKVIKPLASHSKQSFHVVAPDLPGFGFSPAPKQAGLGPREMGRAFDSLMKQLGYDKYGIATTDLGWTVGMWMAQDVQESIIGHMCDFFMVPPGDEDKARMQKGSLTSEESKYMSSMGAWFASHSAYSAAHSQKPAALSLALADSPVGLLGWCWDLSRSVSDGYAHSEEGLITDTMMLWIPGPYANIRAYYEFYKPENMMFPKSPVPTGISQWGWGNQPFPDVANFPFVPEEWLKRMVNLAYFSRHDSGGHFPAVNEPDFPPSTDGTKLKMPVVSVLRQTIPAEGKDKFIAAWPGLLADVKAQPGVQHALGGQIVSDNGKDVTDFQWLHLVTFASIEDEEKLRNSAWSAEHRAKVEARGDEVPVPRSFEYEGSATPEEAPKAYLQVSSLTVPDASKNAEIQEAWESFASALGKETGGGKLISDDVVGGIAFLGWDTIEEGAAAYKEPKAAAAFAKYQSLDFVILLGAAELLWALLSAPHVHRFLPSATRPDHLSKSTINNAKVIPWSFNIYVLTLCVTCTIVENAEEESMWLMPREKGTAFIVMEANPVASGARTAIWKKRPETVQAQIEHRIARLEDLLGADALNLHKLSIPISDTGVFNRVAKLVVHESPEGPIKTLSALPKRGIFYSTTMHFAGFDLGDLTAQIGIPQFCKDGLQWIQDKTGADALFREFYQVEGLSCPATEAPSLQPRNNTRMPSKSIADDCLHVFSSSPLRKVFPVVDIDDFQATINHAYDSGNPSRALRAKACIQAFSAFVTVLEPDKTPLKLSDAGACIHDARGSLIDSLAEPSVEGLQAALMLCIYYDFTGTIRSAALVLAMAVQCLYGLGAHLDQPDSSLPNTTRRLRILFWLTYFLDKHIALRTGRPPLLSDGQCSLSLDELQCSTTTDEHSALLFPNDLRLTMLKSEVASRLYSGPASGKSDAEMLQEIRILDDQLEEWRVSMPEFARPRLSVVDFGTAAEATQNENGTWVVFIHLEYLHLLSAIHRACGRCAVGHSIADGPAAISYSLDLSVYAGRATLIYLEAASKSMQKQFFW
ncbi:putative epoxide hydrolase [Paramyrothecium foliicola]|nr:putative epoxide hydrolase [Paramyrothecium foliicola]